MLAQQTEGIDLFVIPDKPCGCQRAPEAVVNHYVDELLVNFRLDTLFNSFLIPDEQLAVDHIGDIFGDHYADAPLFFVDGFHFSLFDDKQNQGRKHTEQDYHRKHELCLKRHAQFYFHVFIYPARFFRCLNNRIPTEGSRHL